MSLTDRINNDIKDAMRAKDKEKLSALRAIKSALLLEASKGSDKEISEDAEMKILQKLHKQRNESAGIYTEQGREDLAAEERQQAEVIEEYLPKQMSDEEITAEVEQVISEVGASGPQDMGKVMGAASKKMAGRADGRKISEIVKAKLAQ